LNSFSRLNNNQKHFSILNSGKYNKHLSILSFKITHLIKISLLVLILFNLFLLITTSFTFNLKADNLPFSSDLIVNKEGDWTQSYSIQCKLNLTIVFNSIISTSISITPFFSIPEINKFEGFVDRQLYTYGINGEFGIGIRLSEVTSLGFTISSGLSGYLMPTIEVYFSCRKK